MNLFLASSLAMGAVHGELGLQTVCSPHQAGPWGWWLLLWLRVKGELQELSQED